MEALVQDFIREMKISSGVNRQRVAEAWSVVSGASRYTLDVYFDKGVLYCTLSSSMARNQLYFQKDVLLAQVNEYLKNDTLYVRDGEDAFVKEIILK